MLTAPGRCLTLLCVLLGASIAVRAYAYGHAPETGGPLAPAATRPPVDLGAGALVPHAVAGRHPVPVGTCPRPAVVTLVWVGPYGSDPELGDAPEPGDRIFYVYRGWNLGRRFATVGLNAIYFTRRAYARLTTGRNPAAEALALRIRVPADCAASPEDVLAAFRTYAGASD
ncbi:hypothetical protein MKK69_17910 [Methylobacterium sp. J-026]|uniref:hypothetical protein n=1 Tax=Methylobacterium sp. J-026 TaxID=2836624 RepID=UPI001FB8ED79|nr:hypothetical protein [Methylobacterium sp. J-026]MCJ2135905.1 hypothetical protein [Methylobacterium sp. J-026]